MASGSGWNQWVWLAVGGCGWKLWVLLVSVVVLIPIYSSCIRSFLQQHSYIYFFNFF